MPGSSWIILLWLLFSVLTGLIGSKREVGFMGGLIIAIFLSPLIGLFAVLASKKRGDLYQPEEGSGENTQKSMYEGYWSPH